MKKRITVGISALTVCAALCTGCGSAGKKVYEQANEALEQGIYEVALSGFADSVKNDVEVPESYRGAGIAYLRMGNYEKAIECFTSALGEEKVKKSLKRDILSYRASTELKAGMYEDAMADCQTLLEEYTMNADSYFLMGKSALALDSYEEASVNFYNAYAARSTYEMAVQIYQAYLEQDMEADGVKYLEAVLDIETEKTEDYCGRGQVYYYMEDYENAVSELRKAMDQESTEALLLLGMVYTAQQDYVNARSMYQEYIVKTESPAGGYNGLALCDLAQEDYASALTHIQEGILKASPEEMQNLLFNEIVVYEKQLDFGTALQKTKEYLELFPDDAKAVKELKFLESRVQQ